MNKAIQLLNKSIFFSICVHLIGVTIASLSIIGSPDKHGDTFVAEFVSLPKTKPMLTPRRLKAPKLTQPDTLRSQPPRIQTIAKTAHVSQNDLRFVVDTLPVSAVHYTTSTETSTGNEYRLQYRLSARPVDRGSRPAHFAPKRLSRPEWTSTSTVIASAQTTELPPVSVISNEPTQDARFSHKVDPIYPESARLSHKQGLVVLEATIGIDGIARNIEVIKVIEVSGLGCEEAAITALKASQFVPAKQGKEVVSQRLRIPYRFQFKS